MPSYPVNAYTASSCTVSLNPLPSPYLFWELGMPERTFVESRVYKEYCPWCKGTTFDDSRGNCCACGGPRARYP